MLSLIFISVINAVPVPLIIDTDLGFDVDDAGGLAVGNHLTDIGVAQLLGVIHNTGFYYGIGGCDVINHYYGRDSNNNNFSQGAYTGPWGSSPQSQQNQDRYTQTIERNFKSPVQNYDQVPSAVQAYQAMLTKAEDHSVVIASIGELGNLRDILNVSKSLFIQKVKTIYYMDGGYNFGCGDSDGSGWSPYMGDTADCYGAAQSVIQNVPNSIKQVFTLNGGNILTGGRYNNGCGQGPVKQAYQIWTNDGVRPSWDPICVYLAVMGDDSLYSTLTAGTESVDYYGNEQFDTGNTGNKQFEVWIDGSHNGDVTRILDNALCAAPCLGPDAIQSGACAAFQMNSMKNCYDGHGATNMEKPADSSAGTMSLYDCQQLCENTDGCTAVTVSNNETSVPGYINCYRKKDINLGQCGGDMSYDTYTKINALKMQIFVELRSFESVRFEVDMYATIWNVKRMIEEKLGVSKGGQRLMYKGTVLENYLTLSDYGIVDQYTLQIV